MSPADRPSLGLKLSYGFGSVANGSLAATGSLVLFFYNQVIGVSAAVVSLALAIMTFSDAIGDVAIGYVSDRTRSPFGRRHVFIYAALVLVPIAMWFRWHPPHHWQDAWMFWWVLGTGMFVNLSFSLYDIPGNALAPELAPGYHDRTVLISYRWVLGAFATALTTLLTYGVFLRPTHGHPIGQLNGDGYGPLSVATAVCMEAGILVLALGTGRYVASLHRPPAGRIALGSALRELLATLGNRNFAVAILAGVIAGLGTGLETGLRLYFLTYFWGLNSGPILLLTLIAIPAPMFAALVGTRLSAAWGKKRACMSLFFASVLVGNFPMLLKLAGVLQIGVSPTLVAILAVALFGATMLGVGGFIVVSAMVADIVEEVQVATGRRSEGLLFTADALPNKVVTSISTALPGLLLAWVKFPIHAHPGPEAYSLMTRVGWVYLPAMVLISLISISVWGFYRIDEAAHARNLEQVRAMGKAQAN